MSTKDATGKGKGRTRNWATVVYPDSAPENWLELLGELCIPCFVSPLHDSDVNPDGEVKKAHWHVLLMYDSVKESTQVQENISVFSGVGCEKVGSLRGYARYLCHLDNPEKCQYSPEDVKSFGGADYITTIGLVTDKYVAIADIIDYCDTYGVVSYAQLLRYCRHERMDWFRVLCDNGTVVVKEFLKSKSWESR